MSDVKFVIICQDETCQHDWKSPEIGEICPRCGSIDLKIEPLKEDESPFLDAT